MQHIMVGQSEHLDGLSLSLFWMLLIYPNLNNAFEEEKNILNNQAYKINP